MNTIANFEIVVVVPFHESNLQLVDEDVVHEKHFSRVHHPLRYVSIAKIDSISLYSTIHIERKNIRAQLMN